MWRYIFIVCGLLFANIQQAEANIRISQATPVIYQVGEASYYGKAHAGKKTKSGEIFNPRAFTAAHNSLPMGSLIEVKSLETGKYVIVRITDTGKFGKYKRIVDLSEAAANFIGIDKKHGIGKVEIRIIKKA